MSKSHSDDNVALQWVIVARKKKMLMLLSRGREFMPTRDGQEWKAIGYNISNPVEYGQRGGVWPWKRLKTLTWDILGYIRCMLQYRATLWNQWPGWRCMGSQRCRMPWRKWFYLNELSNQVSEPAGTYGIYWLYHTFFAYLLSAPTHRQKIILAHPEYRCQEPLEKYKINCFDELLARNLQ